MIIRQFLRFCLVGLLNTAINYGVFLALLSYHIMPVLVAGAIGFSSGALSGFFLNRAWTFAGTSTGTVSGMKGYMLVQVISFAAHTSVQKVALMLGSAPEFSQLFGIVVSTFVNFTLLKWLVFKPAEGAKKI